MTLAVLAKDESNYTVPETAALLERWKTAGVGLLIIQLFPQSYAAKYSNQVRQMRLAQQAGIPFDGYVYDYLADPSWRDGCIAGLRPLVSQDLACRRLWADEEDVSATAKAMSIAARVNAVGATLRAMDLAPTRLNPTGVYSMPWWWGGAGMGAAYLGNYQGFSDRPLWAGPYDGKPDTRVGFVPFGGWAREAIKQFAGTQSDGTDLDVLSAEEVGQLTPQKETNMAINVGVGMQAQMQANGDAALFGHKFFSEVDEQDRTYNVEQCYGSKGLYVSSDSSGDWVNAGPI